MSQLVRKRSKSSIIIFHHHPLPVPDCLSPLEQLRSSSDLKDSTTGKVSLLTFRFHGLDLILILRPAATNNARLLGTVHMYLICRVHDHETINNREFASLENKQIKQLIGS